MKTIFFFLAIFGAVNLFSQSIGFMTLKYDQPTPVNPPGSKNVLAVWIQDNSGNFIKTRLRFWGMGTKDHLSTWNNKSGGNVVDAITGATLTSSTTPTAFGTKTVIWDGKDVNGNLVPDGTYTVWIESAWQGNLSYGAHNELAFFAFTKGFTADHRTFTGDNYLTNISIDWVPSAAGFPTVDVKPSFQVGPNPVTNVLNINYKNVNQQNTVFELFDVQGKKVKTIRLKTGNGTTSFYVNSLKRGVYFYRISSPGKNLKTGKLLIR